jgi:hypothetical protein
LLLTTFLLVGGATWKEAAVVSGAVPFVAGDGTGGFVVSFADADAFRFARVQNGRWSEPRTIAKDAALLVNRADSPSIAASGKKLIASWSTKNQHGTVVHIAESNDGGATWSKPKTPHPSTVAPFGFVSLTASGEYVWLDGRILPGGKEGEGDMQLRHRDALLDARVCDCCQTAMAMTSEGPLVAYRDRSASEVRDISYVRRTAKGWSQPKTLSADGWQINGCPVNGPQLDAQGKRVVAVWFTAANNEPRVQVTFSNDAGASFGKPIRIDLGKTTGRADVALRADGSAIVTWIEAGALHARTVAVDGKLGEPMRIGPVGGFPRLAVSKENVAVVWSAEDGVHFATLER